MIKLRSAILDMTPLDKW